MLVMKKLESPPPTVMLDLRNVLTVSENRLIGMELPLQWSTSMSTCKGLISENTVYKGVEDGL